MARDGSSTARRAAGTQTTLDVLLRWTWIRRRTPARDIEDFGNGQALRVVGFTKTIGGAVTRSIGNGRSVTRLRQGYLRFSVGEAPRSGATGGVVAPLRCARRSA